MDTQTLDTPMVIGKVNVPRQFAQLFIPTLDGSGSMTEQAVGGITKAQAANDAVRGLLTRMKVGRSAPNFSCGVITFDTAAAVRLQSTPLASADDNGDYNPLRGHGGGTCIYRALEEGERMVTAFLAGAPPEGVRHSAVIIVMSDGCCSLPARTREVARRIKDTFGSKVIIAGTLFATVGSPDPAGEQLLREIASDPVTYFKVVYDAETLRGFMEASVSKASGGIKVGQS
jgi:hypothetical protein